VVTHELNPATYDISKKRLDPCAYLIRVIYVSDGVGWNCSYNL